MAIALLTLSFLAQIVYKKNRVCFCVLFFLRRHWEMTVEVFATKSEPCHLEPTKIYIVTLWVQCPWRYDNDHDHYCHYYCIYQIIIVIIIIIIFIVIITIIIIVIINIYTKVSKHDNDVIIGWISIVII